MSRVVSAMRQLITRTGFFRQHSLTRCRVGGNAGQADIMRITLRPGGCAIAAFCDGRPDHILMKLFIILTTLFSNHPRPIAGITGNLSETRLQRIRRPNGDRLSRGRRHGWAY